MKAFITRPTKGNSFCAEASALFYQVGGCYRMDRRCWKLSWLLGWERWQERGRYSPSRSTYFITQLWETKMTLSGESRSKQPHSCRLLSVRQYENKCRIFQYFYKNIVLDILLLQINNTFFYRHFKVLITTVIAPRKICLLILGQYC